jgi:hypothetical protein
MPRRTPDVDAFRSALARELASVSPRPGGWERVRDALERPRAGRRPWRALLLLAAPLVAGTLMAGALAAAGAAPPRSMPGQAVEAPVAAVCGALAAISVPVTAGDIRRPSVRRRCGLRARAA